MRITFLGQGFESTSANAVGNHLITFLNQSGFHSFTGISAFASESGIYGLSAHIQNAKQNIANIRLIVGVDLQGTSSEALNEIMSLGVSSYIFYQNEQTVFHPKIYLFEGDTEIKLIIGSSNLTGRGLFINVESSLLIEFNSGDADGEALLNSLKTYYQSLFSFSDPNLFVINSTTIADFVAKGIVPDETTRQRFYARKNTGTTSGTTQTSASTGIVIPRRAIPRTPSNFARKVPTSQSSTNTPRVTPVQPVVSNTQSTNTPSTRTLVWRKDSLSQSDAQNVPTGTQLTGNLKLSQARFRVAGAIIDQQTYFRNNVFNTLNWANTKPGNTSYEEAFCVFDVTLLGNNLGSFTLKLSHDPVRVAGQGNTPTWLHWGDLIPSLQATNITGRTLNLYSTNQGFSIEVL